MATAIERNPNLTINPGDRIPKESQSIDEKANQIAVDTPDITIEHVVIPTYFVFEGENGEQEAYHHVRDAEEISDEIRKARIDDQGNRRWW